MQCNSTTIVLNHFLILSCCIITQKKLKDMHQKISSMEKARTNGKKKNIVGIINLKVVVERLQKSLLLGKSKSSSYANAVDDFEESNKGVPEDVKEGHFAVIAVDDNELKRFVLPLSYLRHAWFLRLLEQAAEEYGFYREGALMVPCRPRVLERMLAAAADCQWGGSRNDWAMVRSC